MKTSQYRNFARDVWAHSRPKKARSFVFAAPIRARTNYHPVMALARFPVVRESSPGQNPGAALATLARCFGRDFSLEQAERVFAASVKPGEAVSLLHLTEAIKTLGLEASGVEGSYDEFMTVTMPAIAHLRIGESHNVYVVVHEITPATVTLTDTSLGVVEMKREDFCALWSGYAILIEASPEQRQSPILPTRNVALPSPHASNNLRRVTFLLTLGLMALALRIVFASEDSLAGLLPNASRTGPGLFVLLSFGACLVLAAWSHTFSKVCQSCTLAGRMTGGLPLGELGHGLYFALFALLLLKPDSDVVFLMAGMAVGAHIALVAMLIRSKLMCTTCVLTALFALVGCGLLLAAHIESIPFVVAGVPVSGIGMHASLRFSARAAQAQRVTASASKAWEMLSEGTRVPIGKALVVVFKRKGCAPCEVYEAEVRPLLEKTFGDSLILDEREAPADIGTPLFVVCGGYPTVMTGLPDIHVLLEAVREAQAGAGARLRGVSGVRLIGLTS